MNNSWAQFYYRGFGSCDTRISEPYTRNERQPAEPSVNSRCSESHIGLSFFAQELPGDNPSRKPAECRGRHSAAEGGRS